MDSQWPQKGDHPFAGGKFDPESPTWVNLDWLTGWLNDSLIADAFKEAGDKIINELARKEDPRHPDVFFMPIAYLYRHSLELQMKQVIRLGIRVEAIENTAKVKEALRRHELYRLWNYVKKVILKFWPETTPEELAATETVIRLFHEIDRAGQRFRYTQALSERKSSTSLPRFVDLKRMRQVVAGVFNFLEACESALREVSSTLNDMRSSGY